MRLKNTVGHLVLESGEMFRGTFFGNFERAGEVVFNTSHSGYEEIATDPSYFSQIVVMTAPMQGNYGFDDRDWESRQFWIEGFISLEVQESWRQRLLYKTIPCLSGLDTRALVLKIREGGTQWGALVQAEDPGIALERGRLLIAEKKTIDKDWVYATSRTATERRKGTNGAGPRMAVLDFGSKENILRELSSRCSELVIFPSRSTVEQIMSCKPDGLMLTNGPGDPADVKVATATVAELIGKLPIFGICMGHQILALALGAKTYKMKFGHRGSNHPVRDDLLGRVYMTAQNHGYAVDRATLPKDVAITHVNLNDQTVSGFCSQERRFLGIQYHPESCPGPHEARSLFDYFIERLLPHQEKRNLHAAY